MALPLLQSLPEGSAGVTVRTVLANLGDRVAAASGLGDWRRLESEGGRFRLELLPASWSLGDRPAAAAAPLPLLLPLRTLTHALDDDPLRPGYAVRLPGNGFWTFGPDRPRWPKAKIVACSQLADHLDRVLAIQRLPGDRVHLALELGHALLARGGTGGLAVAFLARADDPEGVRRVAHWIDAIGILMGTDPVRANADKRPGGSGVTLPPFAVTARSVASLPPSSTRR